MFLLLLRALNMFALFARRSASLTISSSSQSLSNSQLCLDTCNKCSFSTHTLTSLSILSSKQSPSHSHASAFRSSSPSSFSSSSSSTTLSSHSVMFNTHIRSFAYNPWAAKRFKEKAKARSRNLQGSNEYRKKKNVLKDVFD